MNKELKELIEYQGKCTDPALKKRNQILIGKKVNGIISQYTDFDMIRKELGLSKKDTAKLVTDWIINCSK